MKKYWFKNRRWGIGWQPASWQGWLLTAIYTASIVLIFVFSDQDLTADGALLREIIFPFFAITFLYIVTIWRTGEPLRWQGFFSK